jgi:hypothetical protein
VTRALNEGSGYGIVHVEDLPIEQFIRLLKKVPELRAVQKLDGANLLFGIDRDGKLYTSREQKGGERFYAMDDLPKRSAYDGFKSATGALLKAEKFLQKHVKPGQALSLEVLFGPQPNTVIYGKDSLSYIAFLEPVIGDDPTIELDYSLPRLLAKKLHDKTVTVDTEVTDTSDGETFVKMPQVTKWGFACSDVVPQEELDSVDFKAELDELQKYLDKSNEAAEECGLDLNNFEVMKGGQPKLAEERKRLEEVVREKYQLPIKAKLLQVADKQKPSLRGQDPSEAGGYAGIEGIIFQDNETGERFKVVDRTEFTAVNKFNYQVRNRIVGRITTTKDDAPVETRGGLVGIAKIRCVRLFGIPGVDLPNQAKKGLQPYRGEDKGETVRNIAVAVKRLSFESIKKKMGAILTAALADLEDELNEFKEDVDELKLQLENGKAIKYTPEIRRRTLLTFAEAKRTIGDQLKHVRRAEQVEDLIVLFFKGAIKEMHQEPEPEPQAELPKNKDELEAKPKSEPEPKQQEEKPEADDEEASADEPADDSDVADEPVEGEKKKKKHKVKKDEVTDEHPQRA